MKKKAVSTLIATLLTISLSMAILIIILTGVKNIIDKKTDNTEICTQITDKIQLDSYYTCYNYSSQELYFSIIIQDINLSKILITLEKEGKFKNFEITSEFKPYDEIRYLDKDYRDPLKLPEANTGKTYAIDFNAIEFPVPKKIKIKPFINDEECQIYLESEIYDCKKIEIFQ